MKHAVLFLLISLIITFVSAIQVSGNQSGTWTPADNPYEIVGDVTIPTGATLTLEPGVVVHAMGLFQIITQGNIIANGTAADSIIFVSGQADQTALWDGIRLENTSVQSQFAYCRIDLGDYGINSINSPASITYCHFKNNKRGIQAYGIGSAFPAQVLIDHNLIELSIQNGILVVQNSNTTITYNEITRNGTSASYYGAIQLSNQSAGGNNSPLIAYNNIHHNYKQGIIAWDIVSANAINPEVHNNLIENNLTGIYFRHSSGYLHHNTVINNFIEGDVNSGAGIMVSGNTAQPYFEDNTITGNYTGFYLTEDANPIIGDMASNHIWAQGNNTISNNIDANNVMHSIFCYNYTNSAITVKAENNLWDYSTALEIAGTIEDNNDNTTLPVVDFDPWQSPPLPVLLTGTITCSVTGVNVANLELVSVSSGLILNSWAVTVGEPFEIPVELDSLVYVVVNAWDSGSEQALYGAFGGIDNPTATQIVADVQFSIGELALDYNEPNWYMQKVGIPELVNGFLSYPVYKSWYVYRPSTCEWVNRADDYLRTSRYSFVDYINNTWYYTNYDMLANPIWRKIANLNTIMSWEQYLGYDMDQMQAITGIISYTPGITYFSDGNSYMYHRIGISAGLLSRVQIYDLRDSTWMQYAISHPNTYQNQITREIPVQVIQDGTAYPLQTGNAWKLVKTTDNAFPTYFGYVAGDHLSFYWIPPCLEDIYISYRLFDNDVLIDTIPINDQTWLIDLPIDGLQHIYTLSAWDGATDYFCENPVIYAATSNEDEIIPAIKLTLSPNPFNPVLSNLKVRYGFSKTVETEAAIFNIKGQKVWSAVAEKGATELTWTGRDSRGQICTSGLYTVRLSDSKGNVITRKIMLIR
jgi:hypothetical protein